jgi:MFS family permease
MATSGETKRLTEEVQATDGGTFNSKPKLSKKKSKEAAVAWLTQHGQMWKFCGYGFFKALKFFEAFFVFVLLNWGLNLFEIGLLKSVEQFAQYALEVPAGMLADRTGKKTIILVCFVLYIISFGLYAYGAHWITLVLAAGFYGFGGACRSGTHKAIILHWLKIQDHEGYDYSQLVTFAFGRTRGYAMIGAALSSFIGFFLITYFKSPGYLFGLSTVPYVVDFIVVASYPAELDTENEHVRRHSLSEQCSMLVDALKDKDTAQVVMSTALFNAVHHSLKDYIQPLLMVNLNPIAAALGYPLSEAEQGTGIHLALAVSYTVFYLLSSVSAQHASMMLSCCGVKLSHLQAGDICFDVLGLVLLLVGLCQYVNQPVFLFFLYAILYIAHSTRKPIMMHALKNAMDQNQQASILSVQATVKTTLIFIFAPTFGYVAHHYGLTDLFLCLPVVLLLINRLFLAGADFAPGSSKKLDQQV